MLWEKFLTPCTKVMHERIPDGQGGFISRLTDGAEFLAAVVKTTSFDPTIAEKGVSRASYTVTTPSEVTLNYHDMFKRNSDNKCFRVTSDIIDTQPPSCASFRFSQVFAEEWKP